MRSPGLLILTMVLVCSGLSDVVAQRPDRYAALRRDMVEKYIAAEGVSNRRVLQSMNTVPRHEFVRGNNLKQAYIDAALPIGYKQTISPPFVVAYMTETIDPQPTDRVLEIGTGSGYQAAVLSGLVKDLYTIEIVEPLGKAAAKRLEDLGYANVHCKVGDGYKGWAEHAPFDKIIVTCSPEKVPRPLIDQLKDGGKMIIPLGERYQQVFYLFEKKEGELQQKKLIPTLFVPMTGISEENRQVKPDPLNPVVHNPSFEIDENNDNKTDHWHYQRLVEIKTDGAREGRSYLEFSNNSSGSISQILQGMAVDGRRIAALHVSIQAKYERAGAGPRAYMKPALVVHFYDSIRKPIGSGVVGPWIGSLDWQKHSSRINLPPQTREIIIRIGLNGGTGTLSVDDLQMRPLPR